MSWERLGEAAKDKDCTCFSRSRLEKVSGLRKTEPWGWEGNGSGEVAGFGMQDAGCRSQDSIVPAAHKDLVRSGRGLCTWTTLASWESHFLLFPTCGPVDPEPLGFQMAGVGGCLSTELALKCA